MAFFSVIVPVYNRPDELDELLESLSEQFFKDFEVVVVEDGSRISSENIVHKYQKHLNIKYYLKKNTGPGPSRNFGAERSSGDYLIFLDSDCVVPPEYLREVHQFIVIHHPDAFGGPDKAHPGFKTIQKAINYSMTSFFTTGGIRGGKLSLENFKPRSFNMGISRKVFEKIEGFAPLRFGEDIDLSLRIEEQGFKSYLIEEGWVYHKRRTDFWKFFKQVFNSGIARIVLQKLHPGSLKLVHLLPGLFTLGVVVLIIMSLWNPLILVLLLLFALIIFSDSYKMNKSIKVALYSVISAFVQLTGYGAGFFYGIWKINILKSHSFFAFEKKFYD